MSVQNQKKSVVLDILSITKELKMGGVYMYVDGIWVEVYPDNDGGLWYWHPVTGIAATFDEEKDRIVPRESEYKCA